MSLPGRCRCGDISYAIAGTPERHSLCHCTDCRRWSGAPMAGWVAVKTERLTVYGEPRKYLSSAHATREFCGLCGTGLFYRNETWLPGLVDIQCGTLDDPASLPPQAHCMTRERLAWLDGVDDLPKYPAYPAYPGM